MITRKITLLVMVAAISTLFILPGTAWSAAGKALFVLGKVNLVNETGDEQRIRRGGEVNNGDTIVTNHNSQIQLRMTDGTLLAIRPSSRFKIEDYLYEKDVNLDKSYFKLIKGGIRSITGLIGKENKSAFGVDTLIGTIGIRGTDFSARLCASDCGETSNGLYVGVMDGAVVLSNDNGEVDVLPGDFGYIQDQNMEPSQLDASPGDLLFAHTESSRQEDVADTSTTDNGDSALVSESSTEETQQTQVAINLETADGKNLIDDTTLTEITEPVFTLPSTGEASYSVVSHASTDGLILDTTTTNLHVNFVNPSATANIQANYNNLDWTGTSTSAMTIDSEGNFTGDLHVSAADAFSSQTGNGSLSGNLSGDAEVTIGAPSDANISYNMTTGVDSISGDITLSVSATNEAN